jgi:hypothetical protein
MGSKVLANTLICSVLLTSCADANEPMHTTVCAIVAELERFSGQTVTISAIWDASYHFTLLKDKSCPNVGIAVLISSEARARNSVRQFIKLTHAKPSSVAGGQLGPAHFTGQLQIQKSPGEIPYLVLDLRSFSNP